MLINIHCIAQGHFGGPEVIDKVPATREQADRKDAVNTSM
ncbi:hypothetical protein YPPY34_2682 [Yersinia pestis PY-34]|uniref:Transposase n=1 Tax=Yersinia pestis PY-08 TaxID=992134 RepID=A0AB72ZIK4_YERPE|nr:hypothetical protein YPC_1927 [Yersinia pestis biovar Medievalis str. Harbin 35]EEO77218.1 hypothetical protein YP516_1955 [Yersinia pestis Nepal516]EIQ89239.1 hypothetical protein YPPY02_2651 [Yersinia pestis PY-02]EIQ90057.1 hypothetical protein YPPY03_2712 [Yersinia pestis PY-03]EIR03119.1 hypothetical protein YPPY05_2653 [Yersinia pestis PY-05]EIR17991.1 hypothetical protein YPPY08_2693 [Yersinia pestis PY-08]EIR19881.1 hypothetical protein YPPY09_2714 [Yersinia pestis PY-09]EIR59699.